MTFRRRRYFQYRVVDVGGSMVGRVAAGDLTYDYWHGRGHTYSIYSLETGTETGWYRVKSEGECTPDQYAAMNARSLEAPSEAPGHEPESSTSVSPVGLLPRKGQR